MTYWIDWAGLGLGIVLFVGVLVWAAVNDFWRPRP